MSLNSNYNKLHSKLIVAEMLNDQNEILLLLGRIHNVARQQNLIAWGG